VDAVAITVKVPEHDRLIRAALAAGKHVFSEWPLGVDLGQAVALAALAPASGVHHLVGLQGYQAPGALFVRELIENGDIGQLLTVSLVAPGGPAGRRIPQANLYATDVAAGATVLSISTGHILATLARAVGEFRQVSAVVALINKETTVMETGQAVPVTAPDQVVVAGRIGAGHAGLRAAHRGHRGHPGGPAGYARQHPHHRLGHLHQQARRLGRGPAGARAIAPDTRGGARRAAEERRLAVPRVRPGDQQWSAGRARLRHRRPVPPVA